MEPRLRYRDYFAITEHYDQIPDPNKRRLYRIGSRFDWFRNFQRVFRTTF